MTSINAIRFDGLSGAMLCDEQRHWNPERLKAFVADKIRPVTPPDVTTRTGLAAAYGNTGTSTIGEELRVRIRARVEAEYRARTEEQGAPPETFLSMEALGALVFEEQAGLKHRHVDEQLLGRYGFTTADLCRGSYRKDGETVEIGSKEIAQGAEELATWKDRKGDARPVFGNGGILAGVSPEDGFRIFQYSMGEGAWNAVDAVFLALGSGLDAANIVLAEYARTALPEGTGGNPGRVDGMLALVQAVVTASRVNLGVGGYFNILVFDGRARSRSRILTEIHDHRARLVQEIVLAMEGGFLTRSKAGALVEGLVFGGVDFEEGLERFHRAGQPKDRMRRFLRGYR